MNSANLKFLDEKLAEAKAYWMEKLSGSSAASGLMLDFERPAIRNDHRESLDIRIARETQEKLLKVCGGSEPLVLTILVATLKVCIFKYTSVEDVIVGTPIHERYKETALLNKLLILRDHLRADMSFRELLTQVKQTISDAYAHQKYPLGRILDLLGIEPADNRAPLFDAGVVLENINNRDHLRGVKNDFALIFKLHDGELSGVIEYDPALFERATMELFLEHYTTALRSALDSPDADIDSIELLSEQKKSELIYDFNSTAREYAGEPTLHRLFEAQVARTPEATALLFHHQPTSYRQLNDAANQLAHFLLAAGCFPGQRAALLLARSPQAVIAMLACLKAGLPYLPLEPAHPVAKTAAILADAAPAIVLTQTELADRLPEGGAQVICLDTQAEALQALPTTDLQRPASPDDLAYLIYTSGSTGKPKGVRIQHAALVNYLCWAREVYTDGQALSFPLYSSLAFDLTVTSIYTPLISGGRLVIYDSPAKQAVLEVVQDNQVDVLKLTPSHMAMLRHAEHRGSRLRRLIVGGEALTSQLCAEVQASFGGELRIFNEYGPTEATVGCMLYEYEAGRDRRRAVPIGRPAANTQIYVLDERRRAVAENVVGELYIGGRGLADGYEEMGRESRERFVENPYRAGERLYRSGDLARRLVNGELEYVGRSDEQVKYHGQRVELGELRAVLNRHEQVSESVVMVKRDERGEEVLVAYYVSRQEVNAGQLREWMRQEVAEEVVPGMYVHLKRMPLTLNGKVNYEGLPGIEEARERARQSYVAPGSAAEEEVAKIWGEVLGIGEVGVNDNFFDLGGHSLIGARVMSRVREVFKVEASLQSLFAHPTLGEFAKVIEASLGQKQDNVVPPIKPVSRDQELSLSFAQQRLWFLNQLEPDSPFYNVSSNARLAGPLNVAALNHALSEIIRRHESLRTNFVVVKARPIQVISPAQPFAIEFIDLRELPEAAREAEASRRINEQAQKPFDLGRDRLLRASLLRVGENEHVISITMHHIITDGWSMGIFFRELTALYEAFASDAPCRLSAPAVQYADYACWQRERLTDEVLDEQSAYWKRQMAGAPATLELPTDYPRPLVQSFRGATRAITLSEPLTQSLKALSRQEGATLFMTLLAGFQLLLHHYSNQPEVVVGTDVANRNQLELEEMIGFFVNMLPLRVDLSGDPTFRELLARVREVALGAYAHQDLPFDKMVEQLQPEHTTAHPPLFQAVLVFQNLPVEAVSLPAGLTLTPVGYDIRTAKFDLLLTAWEDRDQLRGSFEYNVDLFEPTTIKRMADDLEAILSHATDDPGVRLSHVREQLAEAHRQQRQMKQDEFKAARRKSFERIKLKLADESRLKGEAEL
jgi:amino acid adenylation domain-containing protein